MTDAHGLWRSPILLNQPETFRLALKSRLVFTQPDLNWQYQTNALIHSLQLRLVQQHACGDRSDSENLDRLKAVPTGRAAVFRLT